MTASEPSKKRLLTGDRPTGPLHLGHLVGTLHNRVRMQDDHECFLIVADLHSLTTRSRRDQIGELPSLVREVVLDLLSVGIDPTRSTIYLQSGVPAVYDLAILLQMLIPVRRLSGVATIKDMARNAGLADNEVPLGLLGYPVLQAADILMARAEVVPVGATRPIRVDIRVLSATHKALREEVARHRFREDLLYRLEVIPAPTSYFGDLTEMANRAVAQVLTTFADFRSAQEIHELLGQQGDPVGLATVYRTLQLMADLGEVDVLRSEDGEAIYRRCSDTHHHHLVCRSCGATVEVEGPAVERWTSGIAADHGYTDVAHTLEIFGTCPACRG